MTRQNVDTSDQVIDVSDGASKSIHTGSQNSALKKSAAQGVKWSALSIIGRQGARLAFTFVLVRLLLPVDFGIVGQAMVYVAFTSVLLDMGIGATLTQRAKLDRADVGTVFWISLGLSSAVAAITLAIAPLYADFFNTSELTTVLRVLAVTVLLKGLAVVPMALLNRDLKFKTLGKIEIVTALISGTAGVVSALLGAGFWALVVQTVVNDVLFLAMLFRLSGRPPLKWSTERFKALWKFSGHVFGSQILNYASRNADNLLVGKFLGATQLGFYSMSYRTMMLPIQNLGQVINRVALPVYSKVQNEPRKVGRQFLVTSRMVSLASFPLMTLILVGAPQIVPFLFGQRWEPAVLPMQILALTGLRQSVHSMLGPVMISLGKAQSMFRWSLFSSIVYVASFAVGVNWGIAGVAASYTIAGLIISPIAVRMVCRASQVRIGEYLKSFVPAASGALVLAGVYVAAVQWWEPLGDGVVYALFTTAAAGFVAYALVLRIAFGQDCKEALSWLKLVAGRSK